MIDIIMILYYSSHVKYIHIIFMSLYSEIFYQEYTILCGNGVYFIINILRVAVKLPAVSV